MAEAESRLRSSEHLKGYTIQLSWFLGPKANHARTHTLVRVRAYTAEQAIKLATDANRRKDSLIVANIWVHPDEFQKHVRYDYTARSPREVDRGGKSGAAKGREANNSTGTAVHRKARS